MTKKNKNKPFMLEIWTVYDHPIDFPDSFVARKFIIDKPTDDILVADTLPAVRKIIHNSPCHSPLYRIERSHEDDQKIVESWL